ncbi:hypothetical protein BH11CYA1_BH11CYA1_09490 [soil metagenome]
MIAKISKYSDVQILAAANCLITPYQANRLANSASNMLALSAVLTLTVLAESDYDKLVNEVSQSGLKQTAVARAMATVAQFTATEENEHVCSQPNAGCFEESAISESQLLNQLVLLYGEPAQA